MFIVKVITSLIPFTSIGKLLFKLFTFEQKKNSGKPRAISIGLHPELYINPNSTSITRALTMDDWQKTYQQLWSNDNGKKIVNKNDQSFLNFF